jgi:AraC-like DNA-binding protein
MLLRYAFAPRIALRALPQPTFIVGQYWMPILGQCSMLIDNQPHYRTLAVELESQSIRVAHRTLTEGTTFSEVFDHVRRDLAEKYLSAGDFTVEDIAELLGFTDASNFRNSFKRWTGKVPSEFKAMKRS